jgi:predicted TIM-barrel fold metal-dependent hydrolase
MSRAHEEEIDRRQLLRLALLGAGASGLGACAAAGQRPPARPPRAAAATTASCVCPEPPASQPAPAARDAADIRELKLRDWAPRSMLRTKVTQVPKPAFPVIDVHNHLGRTEDVTAVVRAMDAAGVETVVNLDGMWGERLRQEVARFDRAHPGRFLTFALVDLRGIDDKDWTARATAQLERDFAAGAKGLKLHKSLGLGHRYERTGKLVPIDDPKLDPIWALCGKHRRPVMIHTSDPAAFFTPLDRFNERWHELNAHPDWLFCGKDFPSRQELLEQRNRVIARHRRTTFIGAHFGNNPEDLETVGRWLERYPNLYIDIDARISELGRQPYSARRFLVKHRDRILFGTDTFPADPEIYRVYYRFLETDDEYWDCAAGHHRQGFWMIYGIHLPKPVLRKIYRDNARKLLALSAR